MPMNADLAEFVSFHLTGKRSAADLGEIDASRLRPALLRGYRNLMRLRTDYPVVLVEDDAVGQPVRSLSRIVDGLLQEIAPRGVAGEVLRKHILRLEQEIRSLVARGERGALSRLWQLAASHLLSTNDCAAKKVLGDSLARARDALRFDGEVIDCDEETPVKILTHVWTAVERQKARNALDRVEALALKLSGILNAEFMRSAEALTADSLRSSVGTAYETAFDFGAMSRLLKEALPRDALPETRRQRIRAALSVLQSQRFFASADQRAAKRGRRGPHGFVFDSAAQALKAFRRRLPAMVELIKAISIAELEIENRYHEAKHDPFFDAFDGASLVAEDLALFPSYLVCLRDRQHDTQEKAALIEALSSGLAMKVLVQTDDILEEPSLTGGQFSFGVESRQLASMAVGLTNVFVLQSGSSNLYQMRDRILNGLSYPGPALFSVFSGSRRNQSDIPPYLVAAAAMQSRAFPAFTHDPAAGPDWASRFCLSDNPQAEADWPARDFAYEDEDLQRHCEEVAFTFVDFVACDQRHAKHLAPVPRDRWHDDIVPAKEYLGPVTNGLDDKLPYILMVDRNDVLHKVVVDDKLIQAARRCGQMWRSLQELGGIHNSHAERLLARERQAWEQEKAREIAALKSQVEQEVKAPPPEAGDEAPVIAPTPATAEPVEAGEAPTDEPYIETPRCTTCNECTELNNKMFAYDENKQAYIADPDAGTYRQLVEAAEVCQVAIIHPGKPRKPDEPDLDALIKRAEPFN